MPLIVTAEGLELRAGGILADVAPTALELLGIPQPGRDDRLSSLLVRCAPRGCALIG